MKTVSIYKRAGSFAENKDVARDIRLNDILPALDRGGQVALDFRRVDAATQSFVHALISDAIRRHGSEVLDRISFRSCNDFVRKIIGIVVDYTQEGMGIESPRD